MSIDPTMEWKRNDDGFEWAQFSGWFKLARSPRHLPDVEALCPFCGRRVAGWLWSISGSGKRCRCGAVLYSSGHAKRKEPKACKGCGARS